MDLCPFNVSRKSIIPILLWGNPVATHTLAWLQVALSLWPHRLRDASLALRVGAGIRASCGEEFQSHENIGWCPRGKECEL